MDTKQDEQYELAKQMADEIDRVCDLLERIRERNWHANDSWDELPDRIICEHVGDPLSIEVEVRGSYSDWMYGDRNDMAIEKVDVLLGTGGPARGIWFYDTGRAEVWHQDWFTPRVGCPLSGTSAEILATAWAIEFP